MAYFIETLAAAESPLGTVDVLFAKIKPCAFEALIDTATMVLSPPPKRMVPKIKARTGLTTRLTSGSMHSKNDIQDRQTANTTTYIGRTDE